MMLTNTTALRSATSTRRGASKLLPSILSFNHQLHNQQHHNADQYASTESSNKHQTRSKRGWCRRVWWLISICLVNDIFVSGDKYLLSVDLYWYQYILSADEYIFVWRQIYFCLVIYIFLSGTKYLLSFVWWWISFVWKWINFCQVKICLFIRWWISFFWWLILISISLVWWITSGNKYLFV